MLKVLFINNFSQPDYISNLLYIGLDSNKDIQLYTYAAPFHLLKGIGWNDNFTINSYYEGTSEFPGFTACNKIEKGPYIDLAQGVYEKIYNKFYDKIIFSSVWRDRTFYEAVIKCYNKKDVIFIDGDDHDLILDFLFPHGTYFKREIYSPNKNLKPISMAVPDSVLCGNKIPVKSQLFGTVYPGKLETYIFYNESDYYTDYFKSYYGVTFKKGGWDCLRHYEILANKCIPYFPDLENCPEYTMFNFPKKLVLNTNKFASEKIIPRDYDSYLEELYDYTKNNLTTSKLAKYVIETSE